MTILQAFDFSPRVTRHTFRFVILVLVHLKSFMHFILHSPVIVDPRDRNWRPSRDECPDEYVSGYLHPDRSN